MIDIRQRYMRNPVEADLKSRMVFIGGPRQVGKATFALLFLTSPILTARQCAVLNSWVCYLGNCFGFRASNFEFRILR